ncbi:YbaY family lipoprotein [Rhizobium grahamii]|uniref:Uncharacterized protein n=1 Tax=Rhizobium grahamii TaxID=1120045 RepID=A0A370KJ20_9HYPH|nr:hypothetical protein B5K06_26180 [Rhizobium grahamii]
MVIHGSVLISAQAPIEAMEIRVRLEDTTMLDGPSLTIAETYCRVAPGQVAPIDFELVVPEERIDQRRRYSLSARAEIPGEALFATVQSYPWLAHEEKFHRLEMRDLTSKRGG